MLPPPIYFPPYELASAKRPATPGHQASGASSERLKNNLMARYFAAKSILYRRYLYCVLHTHDLSQLSQGDMTAARVGVDAAFQSFLYNGMIHEPLSIHVHPMNAWRRYSLLNLH